MSQLVARSNSIFLYLYPYLYQIDTSIRAIRTIVGPDKALALYERITKSKTLSGSAETVTVHVNHALEANQC